jgi:hypothetical protein
VHEALADYDGRLPEIGHPEDTAAMLAALPGRRTSSSYTT